MPASEVECLTVWSRLGHKGHRIVFLRVKGEVRQGAARSKRDGLGWVPVFLNGSGPVGVLIRQQPRQQREHTISQQAFLEVDLAESRVTDRLPDFMVARERPYLQELLKETYAIYKDTWNGFCKEPSPLFLRAVFRKVFRPLALTLFKDPGKPSELCPHLPADFAPAYLASLIGRLPMKRRKDAVDYIFGDLAEQIEAEVLKLEAAGPSPSKEESAVEQEQALEVSLRQSVAGNQKRSGRKRDDTITDRNKEIAALAASGRTPLEIAKLLDARQKYSVPDSWTIKDEGDGYSYKVRNFEKAYYDSQLRKKLNDLIYNAKKSCAEVVGQSN